MKHGTTWTYQRYKCRCDPCRAANAKASRLYRITVKERPDAEARFKKSLRESKNRWQNKNRQRATEIIREIKSKPCMDCGGTFPPVAMDFDHVRGEKRANVTRMTQYSIRLAMIEIEKCDLVCANCHRVRTFKRRGDGAGGYAQ